MNTYLIYTAFIITLASFSTLASEPLNIKGKQGVLSINNNKHNVTFKLNGRVMYDVGSVSSDKNDVVAENDFRQARLIFRGTYNTNWASKLDVELTDSDSTLRDLWLSYQGIKNVTLTIGNHKPYFSLDQLTPVRWTSFKERSMISNISIPGRRVGASAKYTNQQFLIGASVFGDSIDTSNTNPAGDGSIASKNEKYSYSARAIYRPYSNNDLSALFHIGFNYLNLAPESDDIDSNGISTARLRARLENNVLNIRPLDTGTINNVDKRTSQGIEILGKYNKWSIKGEYIKNTIERLNTLSDFDTDGFYLETAYSIWGNGKKYKTSTGTFNGIHSNNKHSDLEVAIRYSRLDINDTRANILGGKANNITLALNWYVNNNILIKLNHTISSLDDNANGNGDLIGNDDINITGARFQFVF